MGWRPPVGTIFLDGGVLDHFGLLLTKSCEPSDRAMGREVYVLDPDIKKLIEGGFDRFPTTHFEGISQLNILGIAKSAEEAARAVTIAVQRPMPGGEADSLIGAAAIAVFLDRDLGVRPKHGKRFTPKTVYNWAARGKLPVGKLPNSNGLVASKSALRQWFDEMGAPHRCDGALKSRPEGQPNGPRGRGVG